MKSLLTLLIIALALPATMATATEIQEIIKQLEDNLNGKTAVLTLSMTVSTTRTTRRMEMQSFSVGNDKSFIKITYPRKDKGITFLKIDNSMWQYVPRIEKIIKIPASMMLQSWMGSDFSNDDLVKESSLSDDYQATLLSETDQEYKVQLTPHDDAPVVWGKIIMQVSKKYLLPTTVHYFDEDDMLIRILNYTKVEKFKERFYPTHWTMDPQTEEKQGHQTVVDITEALFDEDIDNAYFTKRALKRFSR